MHINRFLKQTNLKGFAVCYCSPVSWNLYQQMPWPLGISVLAPVVLIAHLAGWLRLAAQSLAAALVKLAAMPANANSEWSKISKTLWDSNGSGSVWYKTITWSTPQNSDIAPPIGGFASDEPPKIHWLIYDAEEILPSVIWTLNSPLMRTSILQPGFDGQIRRGNWTIRTGTLKPVTVTIILNLLQNGKNWRWLKIRVERKIDHALYW